MIREVNLLGYLPPYIQEYKEIQKIMQAENPELQTLCDTSETMKDNQFITTCDETGISFFEKLLGITASSEDTLESRIQRVLVKWNDQIPYTYRVLIQKLTTLCGVGSFTITPDWNNYSVTIQTALTLYGAVKELDNLLDYIMPANLVVTVGNDVIRKSSATGHEATPIATTKHLTINTKANSEYNITGNVLSKNTNAVTKHIEIN